MTHSELLQDLAHYPEIDGTAIPLAKGVLAVTFPNYSMVFFDDSLVPTGDYHECENISEITLISIKSLYLSSKDDQGDQWNTLEEARAAARAGLEQFIQKKGKR